jgi:hypothetical protein
MHPEEPLAVEDELVSQLPAGLNGMGDLLQISFLKRKTYLRLAALSGSLQAKSYATMMLPTIDKPPGYILSPVEMAQED